MVAEGTENQKDPSSGSTSSQGAGQHLDVVVAKSLETWFPTDPELLSLIQSNLAGGFYEGKRDALVADLKKDFSLFTYCLREIIQRSDTTNTASLDPANLFYQMSLADFTHILNIDAEQISPHKFSDMNPAQAVRMQQSIVAATVAECLAEKTHVDPDTAYSCGLMRQLGLTLIAWNYPNIYRTLTQGGHPQNELDQQLSKTLGFSPTTLGVAIARKWGMSPVILKGMGDKIEDLSAKDMFTGEALITICRIGESLARAQDPGNYPTKQGDWKNAVDEIIAKIGPEGIQELQEKILKNAERYIQAAPELFQWEIRYDEKRIKNSGSNKDLIAHNVYLKHCEPSLRLSLIHFYEGLTPEVVSRESIQLLSRQVIPAAGFCGGLVYLIEPDSIKLVPRLSIGSYHLSEASPILYHTGSSEENPIGNAYRLNAPIVGQTILQNGEKKYHIAGVLGDLQRAGVLYLEWGEASELNKYFNPQVAFKALRIAFADCLNLR